MNNNVKAKARSRDHKGRTENHWHAPTSSNLEPDISNVKIQYRMSPVSWKKMRTMNKYISVTLNMKLDWRSSSSPSLWPGIVLSIQVIVSKNFFHESSVVCQSVPVILSDTADHGRLSPLSQLCILHFISL